MKDATKPDRLTILQLKEGKEYYAYDGDHRLRKTYRIERGKLQNDDGRGPGYAGCGWYPLKADITFEEKGDAKTGRTIFNLEEGFVYKSETLGMRVARQGAHLFYVDRDNVPTERVELDQVDIETLFVPVAETSTRRLLPDAKGDQVKAYWDEATKSKTPKKEFARI